MLEIHKLRQRNWSRVAIGSMAKQGDDNDGRPVFIKQFMDAAGNFNDKQWEFERQGAVLARHILDGAVNVPALLRADRDPLLHVYEYCEVTSVDDVLRKSPEAFMPVLERTLDACVATLERINGALTAGEEVGISMPVKHRAFGGESHAVCFKGLDIRNMGLAMTDGVTADGPVSMFDFGRPYFAPVEEAAAKFFVSVGLLNWGRPVHRFVRGPDKSMLALAASRLQDFLTLDAVQTEIDQQRSMREREVKAGNWWTSLLKTAGVRTIGRAYFRGMEKWCRRGMLK